MRNLLKFIPFFGIALVFKACITEPLDSAVTNQEFNSSTFDTNCTGDLPKTRLINNGTIAFDLQVINADGIAEITILSIDPGITTTWNEFEVGEVVFSVSNDTPMINDEKVVLDMDTCMGYEIVIGPDNSIESFDPIIF
ncbi:hypothetical protein [Winogradskyella alexanderae]|uniref:Uncharacterized protein n=1 Tax=Winogradskyella alexanderae TaxID=2877123 RepID=A0ABS7XUC8_9FLAO|nr:hypothetical protein [Winogradskyella alexanderae]MCA0132621.1 hypothetical protein [Winogradskyella alexanderae]